MKILQLIYESEGSPFGIGGAGVRAREIYERLADRHEITMLCLRYPNARDGNLRGVRYRFVGTESSNLYRSVAAFTWAASRFVALHGADFDVVVENFLPTTPFLCRYRTRTPVVLQIQGILEGHAHGKFPPWLSVPMALVERFYLPRYRNFVFVSAVTRDKVLKRLSPPPAFAELVENGVDGDAFEGAEAGGSGDTLLFLSRLDGYTKGLDLLMNAFNGLAGQFPEMRLVLAGTAFTPFADLVEKVEPVFRERVSYAGFVTGKEKADLLRSARVFVLPSRHESAPVCLLEAAAAGRPLVVSSIPELGYVEAEGIGVSFETGSVNALEETLARVWTDERAREEMGARGMAYARGFQWDAIAQRFEKLLARVAAAGPPV